MKEFKVFLAIIAVAMLGAGLMSCESNYSSCSSFNALPHTDVMKSVGDSLIALSSSDCTNVTVYLGEMMGLHYNDHSVSADKIDDIIGEYKIISEALQATQLLLCSLTEAATTLSRVATTLNCHSAKGQSTTQSTES